MQQTLKVAESMVHHGRFDTVDFVAAGGGAVRGVDGHAYAAHGIGMSLLFVPLVAATSEPLWLNFLASLVDPVVGAVGVVAFFGIQRRFGVGERAAAVASLLFGFASLAWPYAHVSFDALPTSTALLLGFWALLEWAAPPRAGGDSGEGNGAGTRQTWLLASGAAFGFAFLLRADAALCVAPVAWVLVRAGAPWATWRQQWRAVATTVAAWGAPVLASVGVFVWFNEVRFGTAFDTGHGHDPNTALGTPLLTGLRGLLVSPGKGFVLYAPVVVLAVWGWPGMVRRHRAVTLAVAAAVAVSVVFHALLLNWSGDEAWGPRFLVPVVGLVLLPLGLVAEERRRLFGRAGAAVVSVVALAGVAVQVLGVGVSYLPVLRSVPYGADRFFAVDHSPLGRQARAFTRGVTTSDPYEGLRSSVTPAPPRFDLWWLDGEEITGNGAAAPVLVPLLVLGLVGASGALAWMLRAPTSECGSDRYRTSVVGRPNRGDR